MLETETASIAESNGTAHATEEPTRATCAAETLQALLAASQRDLDRTKDAATRTLSNQLRPAAALLELVTLCAQEGGGPGAGLVADVAARLPVPLLAAAQSFLDEDGRAWPGLAPLAPRWQDRAWGILLEALALSAPDHPWTEEVIRKAARAGSRGMALAAIGACRGLDAGWAKDTVRQAGATADPVVQQAVRDALLDMGS